MSNSLGPRAQLTARRREELLGLVRGLQLLPSSFTVPVRVLQLHRSGNACMGDFAQAIATDPSLTAKVLALVNSASFKPVARITRVTQAVTLIGMKNLLPLVFGFSLGAIFSKLSMPSAERSGVWKAALLKAVTARELAASASPQLQEEAFVAALLQDVALPVLYTGDRSAWPEIAATLQLDNAVEREQRERRINGIDHAELGGFMISELGLPEPFLTTTRLHHAGESRLKQSMDPGLARALDVAASLPHRLGQLDKQTAQTLGTRLRSALGGADPAATVELLKTIISRYSALLGSFGADLDESSGAFKEFLHALGQEISSAMESAVGASNLTIAELKAREAEMLQKMEELRAHAVQSEYDSLTNTLNRRAFFARAGRLLDLAREYQTPCAAAFIDLDDFKGVNDRYGHHTGDLALAAMAERLRQVIADRGILGRLGGDEFVVLLIGKDPDSLEQDLAALRESVTNLPLALGENVLVRGSVGVASPGVPASTNDIDSLLRDADQAMYRAKRAQKLRSLSRDGVPAAASITANHAGTREGTAS